MTPRESVEEECRRTGTKNVVARCVDILSGGEADEETLQALAGPASIPILEGGEGGLSGYWPRVWAMRGLIYAWNESATSVVIAGASDESWRVREMSARVVARHQVSDAIEEMLTLRDDDVARVREAAERALMRLAEYGI
jgi:HEAT repeats